ALAGGSDHRPPAPAMADALVARTGDAQPRRDPLAPPDPAHRRRPPPASATMRAMHIETLGSGPDLVLIHGWALHGGVFAPLVERLAPRFRLHLVDLPGHGYSRDSDVPLLPAAVASEIASRTPPAIWLGWSLGGLFALRAAASLPTVRGLVMVAATPRFVRAPDWQHAVEPSV